MKALDLVDWTQEAKELNPTSNASRGSDGTPSLSKLLNVLESDRVNLSTEDKNQINDASGGEAIQGHNDWTRSNEIDVAASGTDDPINSPPMIAAVSSASTLQSNETMPALLKAIVAPDIYISASDRDRAINLRWVLRDIQNKRLKWWPVSQLDLHILTELGLIEIQDDAPRLTNAGLDAIRS
jgi:hypothetical protein